MYLKKIVVCLVALLGAMCINVCAKTVELNIGSDDVRVKDGAVITDQKLGTSVYAQDGVSYVPIRFVSESLGADVRWDEKSHRVIILSEGKTVVLAIGSDLATIDGAQYKMAKPVEAKGGSTIVPVRFLSEALGFDVNYVGVTNQIYITDGPVIATVEDEEIDYEMFGFVYDAYNYEYDGDYKSSVQRTEEFLGILYAVKSFADEIGFVIPEEDYEIMKQALAEDDFPEKYNVLESVYAQYKYLVLLCDSFESYLVNMSMPKNDYDVDEYYRENCVCLKHIFVSGKNAEETAREIKRKLDKGADFDKMMEMYSDDSDRNGEVYLIEELYDEYKETAKSLAENKVSRVIDIPEGKMILKKLSLPEMDEEMYLEVAISMGYDTAQDIMEGILHLRKPVLNYTVAELIEMY